MDMLPIVAAFRSTSSGHHSPSLELSLGRSSLSLEMSNCDCVQAHLVRPPLSIIGVVARSVFSFTGDVTLWRFHWQTLAHPQLLAHRTDRKVH